METVFSVDSSRTAKTFWQGVTQKNGRSDFLCPLRREGQGVAFRLAQRWPCLARNIYNSTPDPSLYDGPGLSWRSTKALGRSAASAPNHRQPLIYEHAAPHGGSDWKTPE